MQRQVATLFEEDQLGRLVRCRNPTPEKAPVPRFFLGRTRHGNLWRFRADVPDAQLRALARLASREAPVAELAQVPPPPERAESVRQVLAPVEAEWRGPAFRFPGGAAAPRPQPGVRRLGPEEGERLQACFPGLAARLAGKLPVAGWIEAGRVVSVCAAARVGAAGPGAAAAVEAAVETLPGWRGRGLASAVVASWAAWVLADGVEPLYSTSWQNRAALRVARRLSLVAYGEDWHLR